MLPTCSSSSWRYAWLARQAFGNRGLRVCRRYQHNGAWEGSSLPFKMLFMGRDEFSCQVLRQVHAASDVWEQILIATQPDVHIGRRGSKLAISPLKLLGEELNIPVCTIPATKSEFRKWRPPSPFSDPYPSPPSNHLVVTASFGRILPSPLLELFLPERRLNVHPSLLPAYRGPAPIQHTIMNGDSDTGVCVIQMLTKKEGIDAGSIWDISEMVFIIATSLPEDIDFPQLRDVLAVEGGKLLVSVLSDMIAGHAVPTAQPPADLASRAPAITAADAIIDFENMTAESILRRHRAISHQRPLLAYLESGKSIQLHEPSVHHLFASEYLLFSPGATRYDKQAKSLLIRCAEDTMLSVPRVKQEGKALVPAKDWWNGVKGLGLVDVDQIQFVATPSGLSL
ncbi:hypothetical protein AMATHDRAFT_147871 [Amanita thiersii Skay4041]|uniref:methionyl-tRNA formyltransferase n=1 Tax=Amanita thiersii Skay4041 TaxID=703135 RepID=A0A2A9NM42_9AGAR|nr:hypothetical protein AMATHDRAFT_147871 [Amanita thiersii Skay4041]